jgi:2-phosphosulfolactate phosphatase
MYKSVIIDCLPEQASKYGTDWAIVAIDVIRATTTAITAVADGRRCFPAPTVEAAFEIARGLDRPILAGENGGTMPDGFEMDNSPAEVFSRPDTGRPLVLVSSSGTRLIHEAALCARTYIACFRCHTATARLLAGRYARIALIGAGTKGEFREEDQICCAWIGAALMDRGYAPANVRTMKIIDRWRAAPADACLCSRSVEYLRRSGKICDLNFILSHVDDIDQLFEVRGGEVRGLSAARQGTLSTCSPAVSTV